MYRDILIRDPNLQHLKAMYYVKRIKIIFFLSI